MTSTTSGILRVGEGVASGFRDGEPTSPVAELTALAGTGDLWTTVGDLVRYAQAARSGELVSEQGWLTMSQPHMVLGARGSGQDPIEASAYGYGTYIGSISSQPAWFHSGDNPGFRSFLAWMPDADVTLAVLGNDESLDFDGLVPSILRAVGEKS